MKKKLFPCLLWLVISVPFTCGCRKTSGHFPSYRVLDMYPEFQQVLAHYSRDPADSLKYKAACFLLENMSGHYAIHAQWDNDWQPIYHAHREISEKYQWQVSREWGMEIDSLKDVFLHQYSRTGKKKYLTEDAQVIFPDFLIRETDLAFRAWEENSYSRSCSFEDFCEYILPYKQMDGTCIEDLRSRLYEKHRGHFSGSYPSCIEAADSLLHMYADMAHNRFYGASIPVYSFSVMEHIKRALCEEQCWFNARLFSALGMPVAIDFVPHWGNRENSHVWNALVTDGGTLPFDAFWEKDRWKYKKLYNNRAIDSYWGKFRLPKVFRYTYSVNRESPATDRKINREDLPPVFRNCHFKDVSSHYFETTDVTISLKDIPTGTRYCYLGVYGLGSWHPVHWGKIKGKSVTFGEMGRDIVYMPLYYHNNTVFPAAPPFYIDPSGEIHILEKTDRQVSVSTRHVKSFLPSEVRYDEIKPIAWSYFLSSMDKGFEVVDTLLRIQHTLDLYTNEYLFVTKRTARFIRLEAPADVFAMCEITFRTEKDGLPCPIPVQEIYADLEPLGPSSDIHTLTDGLSASGFKGKTRKPGARAYVDFDLGDVYTIKQIDYVPYVTPDVAPSSEFELFYWDENTWKSAGSTMGSDHFITFPGVPGNCLYRVRNNTENLKGRERIFMYRDGIVKWM